MLKTMKLFVIIQLFIFIFFLNSSIVLSASIYRWVDENGVRNFSNLPDSVPASVFYNRSVEVSDKYISRLPLIEKSIDSAEDEFDKEYQVLIEKQLERQLLVNKYKELQEREKYLKEQLIITRNSALQTKREFDILIIKGYFSDHTILELKRLRREMRRMNKELKTIEPKKRKIVSHAGKRGISDKYFIN